MDEGRGWPPENVDSRDSSRQIDPSRGIADGPVSTEGQAESRSTSDRMKRRPIGTLDRLSRSHQLFRPMNFTLVKPTPYGPAFSISLILPRSPSLSLSPGFRAPLKVHTVDGVPWSDHLSTLMSTSLPIPLESAQARPFLRFPDLRRRAPLGRTHLKDYSAITELTVELELKDECPKSSSSGTVRTLSLSLSLAALVSKSVEKFLQRKE